MSDIRTLAIVSDIHYAGEGEQTRGNDYEYRDLTNPVLRTAIRLHRRFLWLHRPLDHNDLLDGFLAATKGTDFAVANGDYSCNSGFIGMADDAALGSARECLGKLRAQFGKNFQATIGDHELGKLSFVGKRGGMRLESWRRVRNDLHIEPFWRVQLGKYVLFGVTSSLVALPIFEEDTLPEEHAQWQREREAHLAEVRAAFDSIKPNERILLFSH